MNEQLCAIYENTDGKGNKIACLKCFLSSSESPIGDWKVVKIYEARLQGDPDPYDAAALIAARQEVRDEINRLQEMEDDDA